MPPCASVRAGGTGRAHPLGLSRRRRCRRAVARIRGPSRGRGCTGDSQDGTQTLCHLLPKRSTRTGGTRASGPLQALSLVGPRGCATISIAVRESVRAGGRAGCAASGRQRQAVPGVQLQAFPHHAGGALLRPRHAQLRRERRAFRVPAPSAPAPAPALAIPAPRLGAKVEAGRGGAREDAIPARPGDSAITPVPAPRSHCHSTVPAPTARRIGLRRPIPDVVRRGVDRNRGRPRIASDPSAR